ncbi:MAG: hypothetical protein A2Y60_03440 [Chloroflexi bacterium RBG_13_54_9]|nr:MAG: hypothetical protein A2Y60_03440 [Chloroflexi bacterium RBG_13_54_9]
MYFPISGVEIPIGYLVLIGFTVGIFGGFGGVGGGWLVTPVLFILGVPMNLAIGTGLAYVVGQAIMSTFRHARFGNVDFRVGLIMTIGSIGGVEAGVRGISYLKSIGSVEGVVGVVYLVFLGAVAIFTLIESTRARRQSQGLKTNTNRVGDVVATDFSHRIREINVPPLIACHTSGIECISVWAILLAGVIPGVLSGFLGVGGGIIALPILTYFLGVLTHIAVGTSLFQIVLVASYATFSHGLQQNVDIMIALVMLLGAAVGAQIGAYATRYVHGTEIRFLFGAAIIGAWASMMLKMVGLILISTVLILVVALLLSSVIVAFLIRGLIESKRAKAVRLTKNDGIV